eukprot:scaffold982_cov139-Cylindrotheca_fusiformis.AAC.9
MEIEARAWTAQLSKAESEILQASQRLEKVFKEANMQSGDQSIPNPVKLVRRLTALEIALSNLKNDCEMISKKRTEMAKSVMEKQLDNASLIEEERPKIHSVRQQTSHKKRMNPGEISTGIEHDITDSEKERKKEADIYPSTSNSHGVSTPVCLESIERI